MDLSTWILDHGQSSSERSVLLAILARYGDDESAQVSYHWLRNRTGLGYATISRSLRSLEDRGVITVTRGPNVSVANTYRLNVENV